jgi:hypothetical protein
MQHLHELDAIVDRLEVLFRNTRQNNETALDRIDFFITKVWIIAATSNISLDALANHFLLEFLKLKNEFTTRGKSDSEFQHSFIESANYLFGEANSTLFNQLLTLWTSSTQFTVSSPHMISAN